MTTLESIYRATYPSLFLLPPAAAVPAFNVADSERTDRFVHSEGDGKIVQECLQGLQAAQDQAERELIRLRVEIHAKLPRLRDRQGLEYWAPPGSSADRVRYIGRLAVVGLVSAP